MSAAAPTQSAVHPKVFKSVGRTERSEERRVGKECRSRCDWSSRRVLFRSFLSELFALNLPDKCQLRLLLSLQYIRRYLNQLAVQKDRKSTRLNSSHTVIYTLSLHDALPIFSV